MIGEQPPAPTATEAEPPATDGSAGAPVTSTDAPRRRRADATVDDGDDDERGGLLSFLLELPVLIVVAFLLAFLLRTFVVQVFYIPSASMEPTLMGHQGANDRILVDKLTYRFREPRRGEIIVFEGDEPAPRDDSSLPRRVLRGVGQLVGLAPANARDYVKRVIGLPGDEVRIDSGGHVFVNGTELEEPYVRQPDQQPCGPILVPKGKLFFLGDNRQNSQDSRVVGYIDRDHVVGRAFVIMWPVDRAEVLDRPDYGYIPPGENPPPEPERQSAGSLC